MEISSDLTDAVILQELGSRLAQRRLEMQLTQAAVAEHAGVSKRTVERVESGGSAQLSSLVRILRVLELMSGLQQLVPETGPRPMDLLRLHGRQRRRAAPKGAAGRQEAWSWDEDA